MLFTARRTYVSLFFVYYFTSTSWTSMCIAGRFVLGIFFLFWYTIPPEPNCVCTRCLIYIRMLCIDSQKTKHVKYDILCIHIQLFSYTISAIAGQCAHFMYTLVVYIIIYSGMIWERGSSINLLAQWRGTLKGFSQHKCFTVSNFSD